MDLPTARQVAQRHATRQNCTIYILRLPDGTLRTRPANDPVFPWGTDWEVLEVVQPRQGIAPL